MIRFPFKGDDGSTIVEFAVVAPLFVLVLFAALQISLVLLIQNAMDTAAREASRVGITGATESGMTRGQAINAKILQVADKYSGGIVDPSKVSIVVKAYSSLDSVGSPEPFTDTNNNNQYDPGEPFTDINGNGVWDADQGITGSFGLSGQVVEYKICYPWDTVFPIFGTSSIIQVCGVTPVLNEAY